MGKQLQRFVVFITLWVLGFLGVVFTLAEKGLDEYLFSVEVLLLGVMFGYLFRMYGERDDEDI